MPATETTYDTSHIAPRDRFAYWSDVICDAYLPIQCNTPDRAAFDGRIALTRLSRMAISHVSGSPQHVQRGRTEIGRDSDAYFMLSLQLEGTSGVLQGGRHAVLSEGDFAIYNTADPYEIQCASNVNQLVLQVSHNALLDRLPQADMLTAWTVSAADGLGRMLSGQIRQCAKTIGDQKRVVQRHLQDMLVDVIATGLSSVQPSVVELSRPDHLLLNRARAFVGSNLRDEALDRDALARAMGMSARNLGRVFAREGQSIASFIRHERLSAVARDLADPRMARFSITEIGCKWGLSNAQHLSKLFKETFGQSPRAYRRDRLPLH